jgi:uncharacterized membrane protein
MMMEWVTSGWSERLQGYVNMPLFLQLILLIWAAVVILGGACFLWSVLRGALAPRLDGTDQKSRRA